MKYSIRLNEVIARKVGNMDYGFVVFSKLTSKNTKDTAFILSDII